MSKKLRQTAFGEDNMHIGVTVALQPGRGPARVAWGRPVGLTIARDGSLLVADDVSQTVWKVTYTGTK